MKLLYVGVLHSHSCDDYLVDESGEGCKGEIQR